MVSPERPLGSSGTGSAWILSCGAAMLWGARCFTLSEGSGIELGPRTPGEPGADSLTPAPRAAGSDVMHNNAVQIKDHSHIAME